MSIERLRKRLAADRASFIEPCLPSPAPKPPAGSNWIHEIKHDGFRLMARRDPVGIRLITRKGNDWSARYPLVVEAVNHLKVRSCLIDGEVVCCDEKGVACLPFAPPSPERAQGLPLRLRPAGAEWRGPPQRADRGAQGHASEHPAEGRPGVRLNEHLEHPEGAFLPARLQDGAGGDCFEAPRIALPVWPLARLAQIQEPRCAGGEARGGRGSGRNDDRFATAADRRPRDYEVVVDGQVVGRIDL